MSQGLLLNIINHMRGFVIFLGEATQSDFSPGNRIPGSLFESDRLAASKSQ